MHALIFLLLHDGICRKLRVHEQRQNTSNAKHGIARFVHLGHLHASASVPSQVADAVDEVVADHRCQGEDSSLLQPQRAAIEDPANHTARARLPNEQ